MQNLKKEILIKFMLPVAAGTVLAIGGVIWGGLASINDLGAGMGKLDGRLAHVEQQIDKHEKALDRDFARHERTVLEISHRTDDQEKRITRLEAMMAQVQQLLNEIRADVKILLRGGQQ